MCEEWGRSVANGGEGVKGWDAEREVYAEMCEGWRKERKGCVQRCEEWERGEIVGARTWLMGTMV